MKRVSVTVVRSRLDITGVVQGVGFRPAVVRVADARGVTGFVYNDSASVHCEFEGAAEDVAAAVADVRSDSPPLARIDGIRETAVAPTGDRDFRIVESHSTGQARTLVPPDVAMCEDCRRELADPADRRYRHPFITCTNCGPRYTVITDLPYDRPATTMAGFPMCARCAAEYRDPRDRRFHAQTIACLDCGPTLSWAGPGHGRDPIAAAVTAIAAGGIVAIKGIGGYHLACRADDPDAVAALRRRKSRPAKPFAVMVADLGAARRIAEISAAAAGLLTSAAAPIVLVPGRSTAFCASVAPGLLDIGVVLAYSPIHHLLFEALGPTALVMTSANVGGSPIVYRDDDLHWIAGMADGIVTHDRPIHVPCEDSVLSVDDRGDPLPLRRSRGYAPLPVTVPGSGGAAAPAILATGGDLKTTFCLAADGHAHMSSHLGDMADPRTQVAFTEVLDHLAHMTDRRPDVVACDLHPGYATTRWALRYRGESSVHRVQHHHAHVASLLAEHGRLGSSMLAATYDGTGYGTDGTIWGGELLVVTPRSGFTRVGHLKSFALPGGDGAARQPARIALDLMHRASVGWDVDLPPVAAVGAVGLHVLAQQIPRGIGCTRTTSMGRLFDGVSSLLGVCQEVTYEGQAAIELEHLARTGKPDSVWLDFDVRDGVLDPAPVIDGLVNGIRDGLGIADLAAAFHQAVVRATVRAASDCARAVDISTIGLTGGVFANRILLEGIRNGLQEHGFEVLTHRVVPCNDGGLALGQVAIAAATYSARR